MPHTTMSPYIGIQSKPQSHVFGNWISVMNLGQGSSSPLRDALVHPSGTAATAPWIVSVTTWILSDFGYRHKLDVDNQNIEKSW